MSTPNPFWNLSSLSILKKESSGRPIDSSNSNRQWLKVHIKHRRRESKVGHRRARWKKRRVGIFQVVNSRVVESKKAACCDRASGKGKGMFTTKGKAMFECRQLPAMGNTDAHLMMTMTTERKRCKQQLS
jgi:hypothetical protein